MKLKLIAVIGKNNELGNKGDLPLWRLSADQKRFKNLTENQIVVMGRKTFESLPESFRPLPKRRNIVLTRDKSWHTVGAESFEDLENFSKEESIVWIIGGGEIYKKYIDKVDELHITHVDGEFVADTFFPEIDKNIWKESSQEEVPADEKNSHNSIYVVYKK